MAIDYAILRLGQPHIINGPAKALSRLAEFLHHQTIEDLRFSMILDELKEGEVQDQEQRFANQLQWVSILRSKGLDIDRQDVMWPTDKVSLPPLLHVLLPVVSCSEHSCDVLDRIHSICENKTSWLLTLLMSGANPRVCRPDTGGSALHVVLQIVNFYLDDEDFQEDETLYLLLDWLYEVTIILLVFGCDPKSVDAEGRTPLDLATMFRFRTIFRSSWWYVLYVLRAPIRSCLPYCTSLELRERHPSHGGYLRQRKTYFFQSDKEAFGKSQDCEASYWFRNEPFDVPSDDCEDDRPDEWPIAWRLYRHQHCPASCSDRMRSSHVPGYRETLLKQFLWQQRWKYLIV